MVASEHATPGDARCSADGRVEEIDAGVECLEVKGRDELEGIGQTACLVDGDRRTGG